MGRGLTWVLLFKFMTSIVQPLTIALVEDDQRIRHAMKLILDGTSDCACIGQYPTGEVALQAIPEQLPQVVIMDISLPGMNGVECVRQLVGKGVKAHFLMLTVHNDTDMIFSALAAGAAGYLLKPVPTEQLLAAVRDVYGGGAPMTSSIARKVVQTFHRKPASTAEALSARETQVLDLLAQGHLYKEIAENMQLSYSTVHTYIERIYKKLQVNSRSQAVSVHRERQ
jgi:hypothetical protein